MLSGSTVISQRRNCPHLLLLLLIIHRHLVDDSDDSLGLGVLHGILGFWCPGAGGRGTVWKSEGGWGDERRGGGGVAGCGGSGEAV